MRWLSIMLVAFLLVGMLLGISSVAYADDPPDPDLKVEITIEGDNAEVWINGRNLNDPVAVYNYSGGVEASWVKEKINQALGPLFSWMDEYGAKVELAADGLVKVILLAQNNESEIETQITLTGNLEDRVASLESEALSLAEQVDAQDAAITARINYLIDSYNRILLIIIGAFSLAVIGLAISLGLLWKKTRV